MSAETGTLIAGRYRLGEPVGQGATGRVWRARDTLLDREVAVKELLLPAQPPQQRADLTAAVIREVQSAARLDHPSVVTIHDVADQDGTLWIVMQLIAGRSLAAEIAESGPLPWQRVARIGGQVADALASAHAAGLVHGDLKPANILLPAPLQPPLADRVIVTDLAIARVLDATASSPGTGARLDTAPYGAPERWEDAPAGPPADLWALGATLYQAVEGTPPFAGTTITATMAAILARPPADPEHAGPLRGLIESLLAKDPATRPTATSAAATLAALGTSAAIPPVPEVTAASVGPESTAVSAAREVTATSVGQETDATTVSPAVSSTTASAAAITGTSPPATPADHPSPPPARPGFRPVEALTAFTRANPRQAAGIITAIVMVAALILVLALFPSSHKKDQSPGSPSASPTATPSTAR